MERKNKKAAESAVASSAATGPGAERSARAGVRGSKRELAIGGNGTSGRLQLLAGGSMAPCRIMSPGSFGSTSSERPPMNTVLKPTISPSSPRPSEKRYEFLAQYNNICFVGIGFLLLVVLLWTLPSFLTQVSPDLFHIVYPTPPLKNTDLLHLRVWTKWKGFTCHHPPHSRSVDRRERPTQAYPAPFHIVHPAPPLKDTDLLHLRLWTKWKGLTCYHPPHSRSIDRRLGERLSNPVHQMMTYQKSGYSK